MGLPLSDSGDFAPSRIVVEASIENGITTTHAITQTLLWNDVSALQGLSYSHSILLWDSDSSKFSGIFLGREVKDFNRRPAYDPIEDFPGSVTVLGRLLNSPDYKRFGISVDSPELIEAGTEYKIVWRTPPGDASDGEGGIADNGNIEMLSGSAFTGNCSASVNPWGVAPIPGESSYKISDYVCFGLNDVFLPFVSYFSD